MMTKEETIKNTKAHIENVGKMIDRISIQLLKRKDTHDQSKLEEPELSTFIKYTEKLKGSTYGSDEYKQFLNEMKPILEHHYECNRHHPEHYTNGVDGMNLIDLIEMFCDWKAATMRHDDGDLNESIKINQKRFDLSSQIVNIFKNSVDLFENEDGED